MNTLQTEFEDKFKLIKIKYMISLKEKYEDLINLKKILNQDNSINENTLEFIKKIHMSVHKLSGSSALMGFAEISRLSKLLEIFLKEFFEHNELVDKKNFIIAYDNLVKEIEKTLQDN